MSIAAAALLASGTAAAREAAWIEIYAGWAAPGGGELVGRVHRGPQPLDPRPNEGAGRHLVETVEALDASPLVGVSVAVTVANRVTSARSDDRGYFEVALPVALPPPSVHVVVEIGEPGYVAPTVAADLPVFTDDPGLGVLTDVDDTLLDTGVLNRATMIRHTLFRSSYDLIAFPDAAPTLAAVSRERPLVYLSGSPWGLHKRIGDFFARAGFPPAPLLLKRFSTEPWTDQMAYKWPHVAAIADALPHRRWICFGDSTESDPEVYARLARERPGRVAAIFIHLVGEVKADAARFRGMFVFRDWREAAAELRRLKLAQ